MSSIIKQIEPIEQNRAQSNKVERNRTESRTPSLRLPTVRTQSNIRLCLIADRSIIESLIDKIFLWVQLSNVRLDTPGVNGPLGLPNMCSCLLLPINLQNRETLTHFPYSNLFTCFRLYLKPWHDCAIYRKQKLSVQSVFGEQGDGAVVRALASHQCGPGSIPGLGVICEFVSSRPCSEGFSPGTPVFLPPQKLTFLNYRRRTS